MRKLQREKKESDAQVERWKLEKVSIYMEEEQKDVSEERYRFFFLVRTGHVADSQTERRFSFRAKMAGDLT